ncbi:MAG: 23S rRNA (guanosine(2251)-2'-O)-methyltransferase RlmB [Clostridia bacterium]|nr:23S rRNA (guanosine(2251)-2'-O)-methyltransferase RlmB [Clostridia bacterium]MBP3555181.1 23S rRNA (guanosine(2251)-2'-O)-methyltransferase RlmB [Clostridia bacterium]MBQ8419645.1 23S rRNA (guanosine(2251)-2'-O)-methyltransferase RlmB [Clostridia bacterium]
MENKKRNFTKPTQEPDGTVIVGRNPIMELIKSGKDVEKLYIQRGEREGSITKIFAEAKKRGIVITEVDKKRLDELALGNAHQGVAAIVSAVEYKTVEELVNIAREKGEAPLIVVCDGVEDPHNLGAIIRSADGAGAHGVVVSRRHCPVIGQTVFKSSAGAAAHVPIAKVSNIATAVDELKEMGVWIFAAEADGVHYKKADFKGACALVLGSEGEGVSRLVREKCDFVVSIPMRGAVNSLNVSAAAAILLFEAAEQHAGA